MKIPPEQLNSHRYLQIKGVGLIQKKNQGKDVLSASDCRSASGSGSATPPGHASASGKRRALDRSTLQNGGIILSLATFA